MLLLGVVSLFADLTYEPARSLAGPYLALLGAGATAVGVVAGLGEFVGLGLRALSGLVSDRTRRYWTVTIAGYAVSLLAVPALALAGRWQLAALLMVAERLGKAVRTPARDTLLSHAAHRLGPGRAFGIHEAVDQLGALLGPLIVAGVLAAKGSYTWAFGVLALPAALALLSLAVARAAYPQPQNFEGGKAPAEKGRWPRAFWMYLAGMGLVAAGFADFALVAFHLKISGLAADAWIPLLYAGAMGVDALAALGLGAWYDRRGLPVVLISVVLSSCAAPLLFSPRLVLVIPGLALWGAGLAAQESIVRAVLAGILPAARRATGFGVFHAWYGAAWFIGSAVMGALYDLSLAALVTFSVVTQLASIALLARVGKISAAAR